MLSQQNEILWGDKWSIENSTAWFVSGMFNILFSVDMATDYYKAVAVLPDRLNLFRRNSNCIKCKNTIFCMPDIGECIWCYDLSTTEFQKIEIINPASLRIGIADFWQCGEILWAVSIGLKQVLEIDIKKREVVGYYAIVRQADEKIAHSAKDGNHIYIASASKGRVYIFDIEKKEILMQELPLEGNGMRTISVDGEKVWLSGYKKEVYIWNQGENTIKLLDDFPPNFGVYNFDGKRKGFFDCRTREYNMFVFSESINAGNYIWFIPFQTNQILYVDKDTGEINVFEMEDEEEDEKSIINRQMNCKYVLQYVYDDRYIGLYSLKNQIVYEIDVKLLERKRRFITIDSDNLEKCFTGCIFRELFGAERKLYTKLINKKPHNVLGKRLIGEKIYAHMK